MASYPWEQNVGAGQVGDVRGGGGGGSFDGPSAGQAAPHPERGLRSGLGEADPHVEDYSDYGAGGPGEAE